MISSDAHKLASVTLPESHALKREFRVPLSDEQQADFAAGKIGRYDFKTLLYDVFYSLDGRKLIGIGPPMLNLSALLPFKLSIDGRELDFKQKVRHKKLSVFEAAVPTVATTVALHDVRGNKWPSLPAAAA